MSKSFLLLACVGILLVVSCETKTQESKAIDSVETKVLIQITNLHLKDNPD